MANQFPVDTAVTGWYIYSLFYNLSKQVAKRTTHTMVTYATADRDLYAIDEDGSAEEGTASRHHTVTVPSWLPADNYVMRSYKRSAQAAAAVEGDTRVWDEGPFYWDGTNVIGLGDIAAKTNLIGSGTVTYLGPVLPSGNIEIVRGNSYLTADGRQLPWTFTGQPSLTSATITLNVYVPGDRTKKVLSAAGSPTSSTAVKVDLTAAQTLTIPSGAGSAGIYQFSVDAVLSNGDELSLIAGRMTVRPIGG